MNMKFISELELFNMNNIQLKKELRVTKMSKVESLKSQDQLVRSEQKKDMKMRFFGASAIEFNRKKRQPEILLHIFCQRKAKQLLPYFGT